MRDRNRNNKIMIRLNSYWVFEAIDSEFACSTGYSEELRM